MRKTIVLSALALFLFVSGTAFAKGPIVSDSGRGPIVSVGGKK